MTGKLFHNVIPVSEILITPSRCSLYLGRSGHSVSDGKSSVGGGSDERAIEAIHLVVESAGITQIVSCSVTTPQWS